MEKSAAPPTHLVKKRMKKKRVHPKRRNGLFNRAAPFWRGERAESIVRTRVEGYKRKKARKKGVMDLP